MGGFSTVGLPLAVLLTGNELIAADTQLTQGQNPESEAISVSQIVGFAGAQQSFSTDNGTTQTLTNAMVVPAGAIGTMNHTSSGGSTPTLTTPTAAALIAAAVVLNPGYTVGSAFRFKLYNSNSGTATLAGGTGVTISGTATATTGTYREYFVQQVTAGTLTFTNLGSGTV